ncbi:phage tail protein [Vibrio sp. 1075]|uniref:phage tail protein n=1 Tax=Vibrio sp. 1075 TaxID=3074543 RepID=UPI002963F798|nr:phage tail protein [Vibrio sp. 1075]MDW2310626.1 phage tail protein [Vibrio sp. 1075]
MAKNPQNLLFNIDLEELEAIQNILGATESQVRAAYNRAISRTTVTIRTLANKELRDAMQAKRLKDLRKRAQYFRVRSPSKQKNFDELKLWFGLNDVPVRYLKGKIKRIGTKRKPKGARFTPSAGIESKTYKDSFVAKSFGRNSIYHRKSKSRLPIEEEKIAVSNALQITIKGEIFDRLPEIFLKHFETDLKGRVKMGLNRRDWRE